MERISEETLDELIVWASCSNEAVHKALVELKERREAELDDISDVKFKWNCIHCRIENEFVWPIEDYEPWITTIMICVQCKHKTKLNHQQERVK